MKNAQNSGRDRPVGVEAATFGASSPCASLQPSGGVSAGSGASGAGLHPDSGVGVSGQSLVTPEMVKAGLVVLHRYDWEPDEMNKDEVVRRIVTAALSARPLSPAR